MKRIAFYRSEFRLCEWPEEPTYPCFDFLEYNKHHIDGACRYRDEHRQYTSVCECNDIHTNYLKAVTSAMENGVAFADQEGVKQFIFTTTDEIRGTMLIWQPKEGDNWSAPEEARIECQCLLAKGGRWICVSKYYYDSFFFTKRMIAVLKDESVKEHLPNNLSGEKKGIEELKTKYGIATSQRNRIRDRVKVSIPRIVSIIEDGKYDRAIKELLDLLDVVKKDKKLYEK